MYIICEKSKINRLGEEFDDEINIGDSDSVANLITLIEKIRSVKVAKRTMYTAIKTGQPIFGKYYIYKIKDKE